MSVARKAILVAVGVLVIAGSIRAARIGRNQRREVASPSSPPVEVSADQLSADYTSNEVSADERYRNRVLRVSGVVDAIKKDIFDDPYVVIKAKGDYSRIDAHFESSAGLSSLAPGREIVIRCIGDNVMVGSPQLKDCVLDR